jgi:hypothetical protein
MDMRRFFQRLTALTAVKSVLVVALLALFRPWFLNWGATPEEARRALPGDEVVSGASNVASSTRAITIHAPLAAVWPWLAQLGQDRGGFYSYEILEDLVGCRMENADRIHPEFQAWKPGDKLWMYPPEKLHGMGHALMVRNEPGRALAFATHQIGTPQSAAYDGSWSFVLEPIDARTTRFLVRSRAAGPRAFIGAMFDYFFFEPVHFAMERKMLEGIKLRAEGTRVSEIGDNMQVALWTMAFGLFVTSAIMVLWRRKRWLRPLVAYGAGGLAFHILTLVQPPLFVGSVLVLTVSAILWLPAPKWSVHGNRTEQPAPSAAAQRSQ